MSPATSTLTAYFDGSDTQFGIFYPHHHLVAVFASLAEATRARKTLVDSGHSGADCITAGGEEVVRFAEEHLQKEGLWGLLMTQLSRAIDTEATYADQDLEMARQGSAFLAVRCINDQAKNSAWECLEPSKPLVARYYSFGGIEHLAGKA